MITLNIFTPFAGTEESMSSYLSKLIVFPWNVSFLKKKEAQMHLFLCFRRLSRPLNEHLWPLGLTFPSLLQVSSLFPELWLVFWSFLRKDSKEFQPWDWLRTLSFGSDSLELFFVAAKNERTQACWMRSSEVWGCFRRTCVCVCDLWRPTQVETPEPQRAHFPPGSKAALKNSKIKLKSEKWLIDDQKELHASCHFSGNKFCKNWPKQLQLNHFILNWLSLSKERAKKKTNVDGI